MIDYAILAPVPLIHIESALTIADAAEYVCFGSDKYDFFREIDEERQGERVPVLLYGSHEDPARAGAYRAGWMGWYVGSTEDENEKALDEQHGCLPPSAIANRNSGRATERWGTLWRVGKLSPVPQSDIRAIRAFRNWKSRTKRSNAPVRGPQRIFLPEWLPSCLA